MSTVRLLMSWPVTLVNRAGTEAINFLRKHSVDGHAENVSILDGPGTVPGVRTRNIVG